MLCLACQLLARPFGYSCSSSHYPCSQFYFIIVMSAHPRSRAATHVHELTLLALLGIPSIPGTFEFKRPPRAPPDVQSYMNRSPPFQKRFRRFGSLIIGKTTDIKASGHAAAMSKVAEDCIPNKCEAQRRPSLSCDAQRRPGHLSARLWSCAQLSLGVCLVLSSVHTLGPP